MIGILNECIVCSKILSHKRYKYCRSHSPYRQEKSYREACAKRIRKFWTGRKHSEKSKKRMSLAHIGNKPIHSFPQGHTPWNKGLIGFNKGEKNNNWKGGISFSPDYNKINKAKRRARKLENTGTFTLKEWTELKKKFHFLCLCCKRQEPFIKLTPDHVIPLALDGSNFIGNIQPLCLECNMRKSIKDTDFRSFSDELWKKSEGTVISSII